MKDKNFKTKKNTGGTPHTTARNKNSKVLKQTGAPGAHHAQSPPTKKTNNETKRTPRAHHTQPPPPLFSNWCAKHFLTDLAIYHFWFCWCAKHNGQLNAYESTSCKVGVPSTMGQLFVNESTYPNHLYVVTDVC